MTLALESDLPEAADNRTATRGEGLAIDCGWGRLLFGQSFAEPRDLAAALAEEAPGERDLALYVRDPQVVLSLDPQQLFLDPSHTYRLGLARLPRRPASRLLAIGSARPDEAAAINALYRGCGMVPLRAGYLETGGLPAGVELLVARQRRREGGEENIVGVVMGVDHAAALPGETAAASLWALAVDQRSARPGVGLRLVLALAERFRKRGRTQMDLSVMYDNREAIALYEKLGFRRVPVFCVKRRNSINQKLYVGPAPEAELNIYARIIVEEARRRGIAVEVEDAEAGLFTLTLGARSHAFRESLGDLTSAVAMSRCDDKALTRRLLAGAGLAVPEQAEAVDEAAVRSFLADHGRIVVKPARGEQGHGVFVDLQELEPALVAWRSLREQGSRVLLEAFVAGDDLRIIVIDGAVVAAAVRRPAMIEGDGRLSLRALIEKQSRRRAAATGGESRIPLDAETERSLAAAGFDYDDVPAEGQRVVVRKTANLHTGGTIHDVTARLHPDLATAAVRAAAVLHMPVVGFDFIVEAPDRPRYCIIEANERPGLANHEPAPTAERFLDLYFPETRGERPAALQAHA